MTKREKDHVRRMFAYCAFEAVVAACVALFIVSLVYVNLISPNNTVATVSSHGITGRINRQDVNTITKYFTYVQQQQSQSGQTSTATQDPGAQAVQQLQQWKLTAIEAKRQFGIAPSSADIDAEFAKNAKSAGSEASLVASINAAGLSTGDYKNFFVSATVLENRVGVALTKNNPTTAEHPDSRASWSKQESGSGVQDASQIEVDRHPDLCTRRRRRVGARE